MTQTGWLATLSLLGPVATGAAALVALVVGVATVRQRDRADQREQWWQRARWALELTFSDDEDLVRRGYAAVHHLTRSALAGDDERKLIQAMNDVGLATARPTLEDGLGGPTGGDEDEEEVPGGQVRPGDPGAQETARGDPADARGAAGDGGGTRGGRREPRRGDTAVDP